MIAELLVCSNTGKKILLRIGKVERRPFSAEVVTEQPERSVKRTPGSGGPLSLGTIDTRAVHS